MKKLFFYLSLISLIFISCGDNDSVPLEEANNAYSESINEMFNEIPELQNVDISKRKQKVLKNGMVIEEVNGLNVICGDIIITDEDVKMLENSQYLITKAAMLSFFYYDRKWPNGVIPYEIESGHVRRSQILQAINEWNNKTSIQLVPYTSPSQGAYLLFRKNAKENLSSLGKAVIDGPQDIWVESNIAGVAMHEIGHAIGLIHEHQRSDIGDAITIYPENIWDGWAQWFYIYNYPHDCHGTFNHQSIMAYGSYYCSKNGRATMTLKNGRTWTENRTYVHSQDVATVEYFYGN